MASLGGGGEGGIRPILPAAHNLMHTKRSVQCFDVIVKVRVHGCDLIKLSMGRFCYMFDES